MPDGFVDQPLINATPRQDIALKITRGISITGKSILTSNSWCLLY